MISENRTHHAAFSSLSEGRAIALYSVSTASLQLNGLVSRSPATSELARILRRPVGDLDSRIYVLPSYKRNVAVRP
jgi:hypothetical protein